MIWPEEWWFKSMGIQRLRAALKTEGEGASVGVWDTGLDNSWGFIEEARLFGRNYLDGQEDDIADRSADRHGSEVVRLIAANKDHWGIAPGCRVIVARAAEDEGQTTDFRAFAPEGAFRTADIINVSYAFRKDWPNEHGAAVQGMTAALQGSGKVIIAAMGNYGRGDGLKVETYPAALITVVGVLGVNATTPTGGLYEGSVNGTGICVCAPGEDIQAMYTSDRLQGTSFACAIVTGVCALIHSALLKRHGKVEASDVVNMLLQSVEPRAGDPAYGKGVLNIDKLIQNMRP